MMTVYIPYAQWFTVQQWLTHNYLTSQDFTYVHIGEQVALTFLHTGQYASFYHAWAHVID